MFIPAIFRSLAALRRDGPPSRRGAYGQWLQTLQAVALVDGNVFVHGGLTPEFAAMGVDSINQQIRNELFGGPRTMSGAEGPLWFRGYVQANESVACPLLDKALSQLAAKRMIVGHTTQRDGVIRTRCGGKIVVIDIGIADHYGANYGFWESINGDSRAVYSKASNDLQTPKSLYSISTGKPRISADKLSL